MQHGGRAKDHAKLILIFSLGDPIPKTLYGSMECREVHVQSLCASIYINISMVKSWNATTRFTNTTAQNARDTRT